MPPKTRSPKTSTKKKAPGVNKQPKQKKNNDVQVKTEPGVSSPTKKRPPAGYGSFSKTPEKKKPSPTKQLSPEQQQMLERVSQSNAENLIIYTPKLEPTMAEKMKKYPFFITFGKPAQPYWSMKIDHAINAAKITMLPDPEHEDVCDSLTAAPWRKQPQGNSAPMHSIIRGEESQFKVFIGHGFVQMHPKQTKMFKNAEEEALAFGEHFLKQMRKGEFEATCKTLLEKARMSEKITDRLPDLWKLAEWASVSHRTFNSMDDILTDQDVYKMCWEVYEDKYRHEDEPWPEDICKFAFKSGDLPDME